MKYFFQTRSKFQDYKFIGNLPENHWWLEYKDFIIFEKPGFLLNSTEKEFKLYLWRIPSGRKDRVGTEIFASFLFHSEKSDEGSENLKRVIAFLERFVASLTNDDFKELESYIATDFPEKTLEDKWFKTGNSIDVASQEVDSLQTELADEINRVMKEFMSRFLSVSIGEPVNNTRKCWLCGLNNEGVADKLSYAIKQSISPGSSILLGYFNAVKSEKGKSKLIKHFQGSDFNSIGLLVDSEDCFVSFDPKPLNDAPPAGVLPKNCEKKTEIQTKIRFAAQLIIFSILALFFASLVILIIEKIGEKSVVTEGKDPEVSVAISPPDGANNAPTNTGKSETTQASSKEPTSSKENEEDTVASNTPGLMFPDSDLIWFLNWTKEFLAWFTRSLAWPLVKKIFTALYSQF